MWLLKNIFLNHNDIFLPVVYSYFLSCDDHFEHKKNGIIMNLTFSCQKLLPFDMTF